jgi:outer membrane receptor protein involved in Fe transport
MTMKRLTVRSRALVGTTALCLITVGRLTAQTTAPSAGSTTEEDTLVLSPFVVEASEDADNYAARNTLAGTRVRTELRDVGSAIQAITSKFLQDTGAKNTQDLLVYTTSTEVGGASGNFVGAGNGAQIDTRGQRTSPQTNTRVRGLSAADNTRDFFLTDIPWDSYNVGRIDVQRGPNSILFGIGSPSGIINGSVNTASFKDENRIEFRVDNNGSFRASADFNKVIIKDELAVRIAALDDDTKFQQEPAFNHDKRIYGAVRYDPAFLKKGRNSTSVRVNFESGTVDANRPRIIPPIDAVTPWFTHMNKTLYPASAMGRSTPEEIAADPRNGAVVKFASDGSRNPNFQPWINGGPGGQIFGEPVAIFADPTTGNLSGYIRPSLDVAGPIPHPDNFNGGPWTTLRGIQTYADYAREAELPNYLLGAYKAKTVSDTGLFDYNNNLIDGPNKSEKQKFRAFNAVVAQTFLDNMFGLEVAYDRQTYSEQNTNLISNPFLTVDIISVLPDGRDNPNAGRAMVIGAPNANGGRETVRDAVRATGYAEFDFAKHLDNSKLAKVLGLHRFTGLYSTQQYDEFGSSWYSYVTEQASYRPWATSTMTLDSLRIPAQSYLSGSLAGLSAANQANIGGIKAVQIPYNDSLYNFNPLNKPGVPQGTEQTINDLVGWQFVPFRVRNGFSGQDRAALTTANSVRRSRDIIDSQAFVWQGFFWDGTIVPTVGWRRDVAKNYNAGTAPGNADQSWNYSDRTWGLPTGEDDPRVGTNNVSYNKEAGESKSWSIVVHTPKALKQFLPEGTDISVFYNRSDNFQPAGGRRDVFGGTLPSPTGKTKDYGFTISALNDRVSLKVNWYETAIKNASLDGGGTGALASVYRVSSNEAWGYMFAKWAQLDVPDFQSANYALNDPSDPNSGLIDPNVPVLQYQPAPGQSVADALAAQNLAINTFIDPANKPPAAFLDFWGINRDTWDPTRGWAAGGVTFSVPSTLAVTGDTSAEGIEYELTAQPLPGWNISINAAKTTAQRVNLAGSFAAWVDDRNTFYQGPAGDVRMWNGAYGGQTVRSVWDTEFYASYLLYRLQENADVPELRPWRFNLVTNYDFRSGRFKGFNVGGGYRWQDGVVVGYPIANGFFDLENPWVGPKESTVDLWVGYERKLTKTVNWRVQLNVRNAFGDDELIPVTVQPDGSPGTSRIPEPRVVTLTNTFRF